MSDTFKCAVCRKTFEKGWTDAEAEAELDATFSVPPAGCNLVCDDCYGELMGLTPAGKGAAQQNRADRFEAALRSIANNTCCEGCQEAAKVASAALSAGKGTET